MNSKALHEAGHAVVAHKLGYYVRRIRLYPKPVKIEGGTMVAAAFIEVGDDFSSMVIYMAGHATESIGRGLKANRRPQFYQMLNQGSLSDFLKAESILESCMAEKSRTEKRQQTTLAWRMATQLVREHLAEIKRLAAQLTWQKDIVDPFGVM